MITPYDLEQARKLRKEFYVDETQDQFGPHVRWKSNDRVPFDDMLEGFQALGWITHQERMNSIRARKIDTEKFLAEYRKNYRGPSEEERAEARAALGAGTKITNVITGHTYRV